MCGNRIHRVSYGSEYFPEIRCKIKRDRQFYDLTGFKASFSKVIVCLAKLLHSASASLSQSSLTQRTASESPAPRPSKREEGGVAATSMLNAYNTP